MTRTTIAAFSALGLLLANPVPAHAHHSTAMFEWNVDTNIEGIVESFEWTNPHTFTYLIAPDGARWALEGMSPSSLGRHGWTKKTLNPGDKVKMVIYKLRDGRNGGFTARVTLPDGRTLREVGPDSAARGESPN
jgi:Family of unknown function (DUF6152)